LKIETGREKISVSAAVLALLLVSAYLPLQLAYAQTMTINLSKGSGPIGTQVVINGTLENVGAQFKIFWDKIKEWDGRSGLLAGGYAEGYNYSATITVPPASAGGHYIIVEDEKNRATTYAIFTVAPKIAVDPNKGPAGINVTVSGTLINNEAISLAFRDPTLGNESFVAESQTNENGNFTSQFTVPQAREGSYKVQAYWKGQLQAEAPFTVEYNMTVNPDTAPSGAGVTVSGTLAANEDFTLGFTNSTWLIDVAQISTDENGLFQENLTVPQAASGAYNITAYNDWLQVNAPFTMSPQPSIMLNPVEALPGENVTVTGLNFAPNANVTVYFKSEPMEVATAKTDNDGVFTAWFTVPQVQPGVHTVMAVDSVYNVPRNSSLTVHKVTVEPRSACYLTNDYVSFSINSTTSFQNGTYITVLVYDPNGVLYGALSINETELMDVNGCYVASYPLTVISPPIPRGAPEGEWFWNSTYFLSLHPDMQMNTSGTFVVAEEPSLNVILQRLDELDAKVVGVLSKVDETYLLVETAEGEVLAKLDQLNATLTGVVNNSKGEVLARIDTALGEVNIRFNQLGTVIAEVQDGVAIIQTDMGVVKADLATLKNVINEINGTVVEVRDGVAVIKSDVGEIIVDISAIKGSISGLSGEVSSLSSNVNALSSKVSGLAGAISSVEEGLATIETGLGTLKANLTDIHAEIVSLNGSIAVIHTDLGDLKVDVEVLGAKVASIREDMNATVTMALGNLTGTVQSIEGNVANILVPGLGRIEAAVSTAETASARAESAAAGMSTIMYVIVTLAAAAVLISAVNLIQTKRTTS